MVLCTARRPSSVLSTDSRSPPPYTSQVPPPYRDPNGPSTIRTRAIPFSSGVTIERIPDFHLPLEEIIIVPVRLSQQLQSCAVDAELPKRPHSRGFFHRVATRLVNTDDRMGNYKVVRMPRREYLRHHKRDSSGNYIGTEPEREWSEDMIIECYGRYQSASVGSINENAVMRM